MGTDAAAEHFRIPAERYFNNLDRYGNPAAASRMRRLAWWNR